MSVTREDDANVVKMSALEESVQGGSIIAKQGSYYLIQNGSNMKAIAHKTLIKEYKVEIDSGCDGKFAPSEHAKALLDHAKAAKNKSDFEKRLERIWESNEYANNRKIWRLDLWPLDNKDQKSSFNCNKGTHKDICTILGISTFDDLECKAQRLQNKAAPEVQERTNKVQERTNEAQERTNNVQERANNAQERANGVPENGARETPSTVARARPVGEARHQEDQRIFHDRQRIITQKGTVILAEHRDVQGNYILVENEDGMFIEKNTGAFDSGDYLFGSEDANRVFSPWPHLAFLMDIAEQGLEHFKANIRSMYRIKAEPTFNSELWSFEVQDFRNAHRCDSSHGSMLLRQLGVKDFDALRCELNLESKQTLQPKEPRDVLQFHTPPQSREPSPQHHTDSSSVVLDSIETDHRPSSPMALDSIETATDLGSGEYHLLAVHLTKLAPDIKSNTPCIVKGGPKGYRVWPYRMLEDNGVIITEWAKSQPFHEADKKMLAYIKGQGGFTKFKHKVHTLLTRPRGKGFVNTVIVTLQEEKERTEALKHRENGNEGPIQCSLTDFTNCGGDRLVADAKAQLDTEAGLAYHEYCTAKKDNPHIRSKTRELTPIEKDAQDLIQDLRAADDEREEEIDYLRARVVILENKVSKLELLENKVSKLELLLNDGRGV
jgi:hypothetical protein